VLSSFVHAQDKPTSECPTINIIGPVGITPAGELARYEVAIGTNGKSYELVYTWKVTSGRIVSGQGTPKLEVSDVGLSQTVTVKIAGLPKGCSSEFSDTSIIDLVPVPPPEKLDQFVWSTNSLSRERFKRIADASNNNPSSQLFIFTPRDPKIRSSIADKLYAAIPEHYVERDRMTFVDTSSQNTLIQIWLVPPGATPPRKCEECEDSKLPLSIQICPTISVSGPAGITAPGGTMTFEARSKGDLPLQAEFSWTLSAGTIEAGQGTSAILVRAPPDGGAESITAAVKVSVLATQCVETVAQEAKIGPPFTCGLAPDNYPKLRRDEEKARLFNAAVMLRNAPDAILVFVVYLSPKETLVDAKTRASFIRNFFLKQNLIASSRLHLGFARDDMTHTAVYLFPPDNLTSFLKTFNATLRPEEIR